TSTTNNRSNFKNVTAGGKTEHVMHMPAVCNPLEPERADNTGTLTWVNVDNDDADGLWDSNPAATAFSDGSVTGGDDELVRSDLRLRPNYLSAHAGKTRKLTTIDTGTAIKIWKTNEKTTEYVSGTNLAITAANGFTVQGDW